MLIGLLDAKCTLRGLYNSSVAVGIVQGCLRLLLELEVENKVTFSFCSNMQNTKTNVMYKMCKVSISISKR